MDSAKHLLAGLKDVRFREMVTPQVIGTLFVLAIVWAGLSYLFNTISWFDMSSGLGAVYLLILGPLIAFISILQARVMLELTVVLFRIWSMRRERTELMRRIAA